MSSTADVVIAEARKSIGDRNAARSIVDRDVYRQACNRQVGLVAKEIGVNPFWATHAILTTTSDYDIEFSAASEYERVLDLVYASDKRPLRKVSKDEIFNDRASSATTHGRPYKFALDVDNQGRVVVMFGVLPTAGEYIDAYLTTMPEDWDGVTTPPTIPFASSAVNALTLLVCVDVVSSLGEDKMVALDLSPKAVASWRDMAMELIRLERATIIRMKRARSGNGYGWFNDWVRR